MSFGATRGRRGSPWAWGLVVSWAIGGLLVLAVGVPDLRELVQPVDDEAREWAVSAERDVPVAAAKVLAGVGSLWLMVPLVGVVAMVLGVRRRWPQLAALLVSFALAQLLHGPIKATVERERPPGPLVETGEWSFPSGHGLNAAAIAIVFVVVWVPPGPRRPLWLSGALGYALVMAWSRVYLRAHWLTDVVAGVAFGVAAALTAVAVVGLSSRARCERSRRHSPMSPRPSSRWERMREPSDP